MPQSVNLVNDRLRIVVKLARSVAGWPRSAVPPDHNKISSRPTRMHLLAHRHAYNAHTDVLNEAQCDPPPILISVQINPHCQCAPLPMVADAKFIPPSTTSNITTGPSLPSTFSSRLRRKPSLNNAGDHQHSPEHKPRASC